MTLTSKGKPMHDPGTRIVASDRVYIVMIDGSWRRLPAELGWAQ